MEINIKNKLAYFFIIVYKIFKTIFLFGEGNCKYIPSCSKYAEEAIKKLPIHKAILKIIIRILKCNPLSKGGYDPV